jgi:16S rRNA processing protein RimM
MSKKISQVRLDQARSSGSPDSGEPEFLAVGKLHRPHGLRGDILMSVWTDFPERLQAGKQVFVGKTHEPLRIKNFRKYGQGSLVSFEGYSDREQVGDLRNLIVFVATNDLPPLPDHGIYLHQLLGLRVVRDEDDAFLGSIVEIIETGANLVFLVRGSGKRDILLPDIEPVVQIVDLEKGEMRVHLLPGLVPDDQL